MNNVRRKVLGYDAALALLKEGKRMIHNPGGRTTIDGLTIVWPSHFYLMPLCKPIKEGRKILYYTLKETI